MSTLKELNLYASLGTLEKYNSKLKHLSQIAEPESWYFDYNPQSLLDQESYNLKCEYALLNNYLKYTFAKAYTDGLVIKSEDNAIMNTGLLTMNVEEIFMLFGKNTKYNEDDRKDWFFIGFYKKSDRTIPENMRSSLPKHVDYFKDDITAMYFDVSKEIIVNVDHIIEDNFERLPTSLQSLDKSVIHTIIQSLVDQMKIRISRNFRLVVPQFYNGKITYLAPLVFGKDVIPLAIERTSDTYRANTILTQSMAYCNARLIARPESNWLVNK